MVYCCVVVVSGAGLVHGIQGLTQPWVSCAGGRRQLFSLLGAYRVRLNPALRIKSLLLVCHAPEGGRQVTLPRPNPGPGKRCLSDQALTRVGMRATHPLAYPGQRGSNLGVLATRKSKYVPRMSGWDKLEEVRSCTAATASAHVGPCVGFKADPPENWYKLLGLSNWSASKSRRLPERAQFGHDPLNGDTYPDFPGCLVVRWDEGAPLNLGDG